MLYYQILPESNATIRSEDVRSSSLKVVQPFRLLHVINK